MCLPKLPEQTEGRSEEKSRREGQQGEAIGGYDRRDAAKPRGTHTN